MDSGFRARGLAERRNCKFLSGKIIPYLQRLNCGHVSQDIWKGPGPAGKVHE